MHNPVGDAYGIGMVATIRESQAAGTDARESMLGIIACGAAIGMQGPPSGNSGRYGDMCGHYRHPEGYTVRIHSLKFG